MREKKVCVETGGVFNRRWRVSEGQELIGKLRAEDGAAVRGPAGKA